MLQLAFAYLRLRIASSHIRDRLTGNTPPSPMSWLRAEDTHGTRQNQLNSLNTDTNQPNVLHPT